MNKLWAFGCSHVKGHELGNSGWNGFNEDLSFTGVIAKNLNLKQENRASNGVGIDYCFDSFLQSINNINWNNDLVIFSSSNALRWQSEQENEKQMSNIINDPNRCCTKFFLRNMPNIRSFYMYRWAILNYIKLTYPKTIIVAFSNKIYLQDEFKFEYFNDLTIEDFSAGKPNEFQYPGGHYFESKHKEFADYLTNKITSNGFYKNTV